MCLSGDCDSLIGSARLAQVFGKAGRRLPQVRSLLAKFAERFEGVMVE